MRTEEKALYVGQRVQGLGPTRPCPLYIPVVLWETKSLRTRVLSNHIALLTLSDPEPERQNERQREGWKDGSQYVKPIICSLTKTIALVPRAPTMGPAPG